MVQALSGYASALIWLLISSCLLTGALTEWHTSTIRWNGVSTSFAYDGAHPHTERNAEASNGHGTERVTPVPMSSYTTNVCLLLTSIYYHGPTHPNPVLLSDNRWQLLSGTIARNQWLAHLRTSAIQEKMHPYSGHLLRFRKQHGAIVATIIAFLFLLFAGLFSLSISALYALFTWRGSLAEYRRLPRAACLAPVLTMFGGILAYIYTPITNTWFQPGPLHHETSFDQTTHFTIGPFFVLVALIVMITEMAHLYTTLPPKAKLTDQLVKQVCYSPEQKRRGQAEKAVSQPSPFAPPIQTVVHPPAPLQAVVQHPRFTPPQQVIFHPPQPPHILHHPPTHAGPPSPLVETPSGEPFHAHHPTIPHPDYPAMEHTSLRQADRYPPIERLSSSHRGQPVSHGLLPLLKTHLVMPASVDLSKTTNAAYFSSSSTPGSSPRLPAPSPSVERDPSSSPEATYSPSSTMARPLDRRSLQVTPITIAGRSPATRQFSAISPPAQPLYSPPTSYASPLPFAAAPSASHMTLSPSPVQASHRHNSAMHDRGRHRSLRTLRASASSQSPIIRSVNTPSPLRTLSFSNHSDVQPGVSIPPLLESVEDETVPDTVVYPTSPLQHATPSMQRSSPVVRPLDRAGEEAMPYKRHTDSDVLSLHQRERKMHAYSAVPSPPQGAAASPPFTGRNTVLTPPMTPQGDEEELAEAARQRRLARGPVPLAPPRRLSHR